MVHNARVGLGPVGPALAVCLLLGASACGAPEVASPGATASPTAAAATSAAAPTSPVPSSPGSATPTDPAAAFCTELKANGATGADFGPIPLFYRKKQLLADVDGKQRAMGDAAPPTAIAKPWALQKKALRRVKAAAEKLSEGKTLSAYDYDESDDDALDKAQHTLTDYWFAHCG